MEKNEKVKKKKNYKTLKKEFEEDINKQKKISCSCIGRINIVKMPKVSKTIYIFNAMPIKIPMAFLSHTHKTPKSCVEPQKTLNS